MDIVKTLDVVNDKKADDRIRMVDGDVIKLRKINTITGRVYEVNFHKIAK